MTSVARCTARSPSRRPRASTAASCARRGWFEPTSRRSITETAPAPCRQFAPGALSSVELPRHRGGCGGSLAASIGYRDPRGYPVYQGSRVARIASVSIHGRSARVVATTVTRFAEEREPSIEDDIVYLRQTGGRWLISKPSAALYRAIGAGDIPPRALAPP